MDFLHFRDKIVQVWLKCLISAVVFKGGLEHHIIPTIVSDCIRGKQLAFGQFIFARIGHHATVPLVSDKIVVMP